MTVPVTMNGNKTVYVGAATENKPFTIHSTDQTAPGEQVYLYYDRVLKRTNIFDPSSYKGLENLHKKKVLGLTRSALYRGIYLDGNEFILPVHDYAANTALSLTDIVEIAQSGEWMVRNNNQYDIYSSNESPKWSDNSFEELLQIAFKGHIIENDQHPLVKGFRYLK